VIDFLREEYDFILIDYFVAYENIARTRIQMVDIRGCIAQGGEDSSLSD
jgi:hypothetical protein